MTCTSKQQSQTFTHTVPTLGHGMPWVSFFNLLCLTCHCICCIDRSCGQNLGLHQGQWNQQTADGCCSPQTATNQVDSSPKSWPSSTRRCSGTRPSDQFAALGRHVVRYQTLDERQRREGAERAQQDVLTVVASLLELRSYNYCQLGSDAPFAVLASVQSRGERRHA